MLYDEMLGVYLKLIWYEIFWRKSDIWSGPVDWQTDKGLPAGRTLSAKPTHFKLKIHLTESQDVWAQLSPSVFYHGRP